MKAKLIYLFFALCFFSFANAQGPSVIKGTCGEDITYTLDLTTGKLHLSGYGDMYNYRLRSGESPQVPWSDYKDSIKEVTMDDGITSIGNCAFINCRNILHVKLSNNLKSIGDYSFSDCKFSNIELPETLNSIGWRCFEFCYNLKKLRLPKNIKEIKAGAFSFSGISRIDLPNSITAISDSLFYCADLRSLDISSSVTKIGNGSFASSYIESIIIPETVKSISARCFLGCENLKNLVIPNSIVNLPEYSCPTIIDKIIIGNSVSYIDDDFMSSWRSSLKSMTLTSAVPIPFTNANSSLGKILKNTTFYVPNESYCKSKYWKDYNLIVYTLPESLDLIDEYIELQDGDSTLLTVDSDIELNEGMKVFQSSDVLVVSVADNGAITATGPGEATIYFHYADLKRECKVKVLPKYTSLKFEKESIEMEKGKSQQMAVIAEGTEPFDPEDVTLTVLNPNIASVSTDGTVTALHIGTTKIVCDYGSGGLSDTCTVNVKCDVNKIDINMPSVTVEKGKTCSLTCTTTPETKYLEDMKWTSDNTSIANVSKDGVVTGVGYGSTYIRCNYDGIVSDSCKVTVYNAGLVYVGNIYYRLKTDLTAEVTNSGDSPRSKDSEGLEYAGTVNIPSAVTYDGVTYTVKSIRPYAFYNMRDLQAIVVPSTVETIDTLACAYSKKLAKVMFLNKEENLQTINDSAFYECSRLNDVALPNSTLRIDKEAFRHCTSLSKISLGKSLNFINEYAFADCPVLDNLKFPETLKSIQTAAFTNDVALSSITFPAGLQGIGAAAFSNCTAMKQTTFETYNSTLTIGMGAFNNCTAIEKVNIAHLDSWAHINFSDETANPTSQAHHIFMDGAEIIDAYLPTSTKYINNNVFTGCISLRSISIPSTVEYVNDNILYGCTALERVTCHRQTPPPFLGTDNPEKMNNVFGKATLYVLDTAADSYRGDGWWKHFTSIVGKSSLAQLVLTPQTLTIKVGETYKLRAAMVDESSNLDASGSVLWSSSDKSIATVKSDGTVTGIGIGTVTITCKNPIDNTMVSTCALTVVSDGLVKQITLDKTTLTLNSGDASQLKATVGPETALDKSVRWSSSDLSVATVNSEGVVIAIGSGTATITCEAHDGGGAKTTCLVTTTNTAGKQLFNPYTDFRQTRDLKMMFDVTVYGRYYFANNWEELSPYVTAMYVNGVEVTPTQYMDLYPGAYWVVYRTKDMEELPMAALLNLNGEEVDEVKDSKYGKLTELHLPGKLTSIGGFNGYGCWYCSDVYVYGRTNEISSGLYVFNTSSANPTGQEACGRYVDGNMKSLHVCGDEPEALGSFLQNLTGNGYTVKRDLTYKDPSSETDDPALPDGLYADINNDGIVNVTDVVALTNYISTNDAKNVNTLWVDMNEDGVVNVTDVVYLINYISNE